MTHVRTSPFYPQSNGKIERWHKSLKRECIRTLTPLTLDDARRLIQLYVDHYNTMRLHSAIGYVTRRIGSRTTGRDPRGSRSQVRRSSSLAATPTAADGVLKVCNLFYASYNDLVG